MVIRVIRAIIRMNINIHERDASSLITQGYQGYLGYHKNKKINIHERDASCTRSKGYSGLFRVIRVIRAIRATCAACGDLAFQSILHTDPRVISGLS